MVVDDASSPLPTGGLTVRELEISSRIEIAFAEVEALKKWDDCDIVVGTVGLRIASTSAFSTDQGWQNRVILVETGVDYDRSRGYFMHNNVFLNYLVSPNLILLGFVVLGHQLFSVPLNKL